MRMNLWMLCLATSLAVAATADAQPNGAGGGRSGIGGFANGGVGAWIFGIAANEAVQKELGLSDETAEKVRAVAEECNTAIREVMTSSRGGAGNSPDMTREERIAANAKIAATLKTTADRFLPKLQEAMTADQFARLQQINWQSMGIAALSDAEVIKAIPISKEQQDKIQSINKEYDAKRAELITGIRGGKGDFIAKMQEQDKAREAEITDVLAKDQQEKFASLKGKEFDVSQLPPFGGGRVSTGFGSSRGSLGEVVGGVVGIAANDAVQKELGLSAEAKVKLKSVSEECDTAILEALNSSRGRVADLRGMSREERNAAMDKRAEIRKATADQFLPKLKDVLTADQFTRLQQIHWQSMGTAALSDAEVVKAIPISKEQQDTIRSLNTEYAAKRADLFTGGGAGVPRIEPSAFAKMQIQNTEVDRERDARIMEVLTKVQQAKFASLKGKGFDLSQLLRSGGGGNGGPPGRSQPGAG